MCSLTSVFWYFTEVDSTRKNDIVGKYGKTGTSDKATIGGGSDMHKKMTLTLYFGLFGQGGQKSHLWMLTNVDLGLICFGI